MTEYEETVEKEGEVQMTRITKEEIMKIAAEGKSLVGLNLRECDLSGVNLEGADLAGADLQQTNLQGAHLARANLTAANLAKADLTGADLRRAKLYNANLHFACLRNVDLTDALLSPDSIDLSDTVSWLYARWDPRVKAVLVKRYGGKPKGAQVILTDGPLISEMVIEDRG